MLQARASSSPFSQACPFCRIIQTEEKAAILFEDELSLAFLDRRPLFPGHCLCIPKAHYETLVDLPAAWVGPLFQTVQLLERAIEEGLHAEGTFIGINNRVSQSIPHLHIHLVPRHRKDGLRRFFWPGKATQMKGRSSRCKRRCALPLPAYGFPERGLNQDAGLLVG